LKIISRRMRTRVGCIREKCWTLHGLDGIIRYIQSHYVVLSRFPSPIQFLL
jgi:hypothetical protein